MRAGIRLRKFLLALSPESKLPTIQLLQSNLENQNKKEEIKPTEKKLTEPNITEQEVSALLAADLSMNRKLTVESFQYF